MFRFGNLEMTIMKREISWILLPLYSPLWSIHLHAYIQICFEAAQPGHREHGELSSESAKAVHHHS